MKMECIKNVKILACLAAEVDSSAVWSNCISYETASRHRLFVLQADAGPEVVVRIRFASRDFEKRYSQPPRITILDGDKYLVVSEHYRQMLGIDGTTCKMGKTVVLHIRPSRCPILSSIRAACASPDPFLRLSVCLAWLSTALGLISLVLSLMFGGCNALKG
jgi:hypothetical protein